MKFAAVVVLVALALGANSSVVPLGWPGTVVVGNPHAAISIDHSPLGHLVAAPGSLAVHAAAGHAVHDIHGLHGIHAAPGSLAVHAATGPAVHDIHGLHGIHGIHAGPGSLAVHAAAGPAVHDIHGLHGIHGIHGIHSPVQIVSAHHAVVPAVIPAAATSVSKTRGALHVAPLPGHIQSVVQANLQPAPGTL